MDPRTVELINLDIDGRLDSTGRAELEALLMADPAVRTHQAELRAVARVLASAPAAELPAGFRDSVLQRARLPQRNTVRRVLGYRQRRAVLALAASVALAVVVLQVLKQEPIGSSDQLTGTLARATPSVTATPVPDGLRLVFDLPAGAPANLIIDFGSGDQPLSAKTDAQFKPRIEGRRIVLTGAGAGRMTVLVNGNVAPGDFVATVERDGVVTQVTHRTGDR